MTRKKASYHRGQQPAAWARRRREKIETKLQTLQSPEERKQYLEDQKKWTQLRITSRAMKISKGGLSNNAKEKNKLLLDRDERLLKKVDGELEALKTADQDKPSVEHDTPDKDGSGIQVVS